MLKFRIAPSSRHQNQAGYPSATRLPWEKKKQALLRARVRFKKQLFRTQTVDFKDNTFRWPKSPSLNNFSGNFFGSEKLLFLNQALEKIQKKKHFSGPEKSVVAVLGGLIHTKKLASECSSYPMQFWGRTPPQSLKGPTSILQSPLTFQPALPGSII